MASSTRAMATMPSFSRLASRQAPLGSSATLRALSTASRSSARSSALGATTARPTLALQLPRTGRVAFQRAYADGAPKPKPGKLRRTFRWAWRITYLSATGLLGYTFYTIWQDRHPEPQVEQDPKKKTLVVLGESTPAACAAHAHCHSEQALGQS